MARTRVTDIDNPVALGARLREIREARGLTLKELSFPGCSGPYISVIEHGRRVPSLQVLNALAERLGVSSEFLATGSENTLLTRFHDAELALRLGDPNEAVQLFTSLLEESEGALRARALGGLGIAAIQQGDLSLGVQHLEEAQNVRSSEFLDEVSLVEALGRAYATTGEYESATALFLAAKEAAQERGDATGSLKLTVLLANTYIDLGDTIHSNEALAAALNAVRDLKDPRLRATVFWAQARLHTVEGRHDLAADFAERALETLRVNEDERAIAFAQQMLAYIETERGNFERALELLDEAAPMIRRVAEPVEAAVFELERARSLASLGRDIEAVALLQEIGPLVTSQTGDDSGRYFVLLGSLYERLGQDDDALLVYDAAIETLGSHRSPYLARAWRNKAELLEGLGKTSDALAAFREALAQQDRAGNGSAA